MLETDPIPLLEISDRQDLYSMAYVRAIIAAAGFNHGNLALDRNSCDVEIVHARSNGFFPFYSRLCIQVKCTYAHTIKNDGAIHFPLPIKNYNDLRQSQIEPHILVAVLIPRPDLRETEPWIECVNGHTVFRYRAYWLSLLEAVEPKNGQKNVTVKIPACNTFDVSTVNLLMTHMVAEGNKQWSG
jgi:hypothetical protein